MTNRKKQIKDKDILTKEKAKKIIAFNDGMAHTFYNVAIGLVGGDHSKSSLFKDIDNSFMCKKTGEQALGMGHGLVVIPKEKCNQSELLFVETKKSFNEKELSGLILMENNKKLKNNQSKINLKKILDNMPNKKYLNPEQKLLKKSRRIKCHT